jgi:hypothetical protein
MAARVGGGHAILERQAGEFAIELVRPLVVGAHEAAGVAVGLLAEAHPAVGAAVLDHANAGIDAAILRRDAIADHDHLALADGRELEIADVGDLDFEADVAPVRAVEDFLQLLPVQLRVGVGPERHAAGPGGGPARKGLGGVPAA